MSPHRERHGDDLRSTSAGEAPRHRFAPYELAVCGRSGSGKTTVVTALIRDLSPRYRIGYVKHDAHGFAMDREGKDTHRAAESGARSVLIGDAERYALLGAGELDARLLPLLFQEVDFVLAEGYRSSELAKLVVVDRDGQILDEVESGVVDGVVGIILRDDVAPRLAERARRIAGGLTSAGGLTGAGGIDLAAARPVVLSAADLPSVRDFVLGHFAAQARAIPLYGLVLSGGRSSRMGRDKASIPYHGRPQVRWAAGLLSELCERVFVSTRSDQAAEQQFAGLEQLHDRFLDIGPMGGILTALHAHPSAAWLVLGCDLPFVSRETLGALLDTRDPFRLATCYESPTDGLPEPLCALYEPGYRLHLHQFLASGRTCPRKALIQSRSRRLPLRDPHALDNVNYPEEAEAALARIVGKGEASR